ncbi:MAG: hypothetical protein JO180_06410 [Gemmatirosa sp.]|nr:hypothetical protein [Gemmatirosa sp.]
MTPFLADAIFWIAVVSCAVAQIAILRATAAARAGYAASPARRPAGRVTEVVWAVLPPLALIGVLLLTWRALHPRTDAPATVTAGIGAAS